MSVLVEARGVTKHFSLGRGKTVHAVDDLSLTIDAREIVGLVGESGSGKSTFGKALVGLHDKTAGEVYLEGERLPQRYTAADFQRYARRMQMIFQDPYSSLNPRMTVGEIVVEGLRLHGGASDAQVRETVKSWLERVGLEGGYAGRYPHELSGGQRQRVALGRAMVCKPKVFLLDEPLSNLDARMRAGMRAEIAELHRRLRTTMIFVTHDQTEAMTLGQRLCVLDLGQVMQIGSPMDLYRRPAHRFVGDFIGTPGMNFVRGRLEDRDGGLAFVGSGDNLALGLGGDLAKHAGGEVEMGIRPENISLAAGAGDATWTVQGCETLGHESLLRVRCGDHELVVRVPGAGAGGLAKVGLRFDLNAAAWFDAATGQALG